MSNASFSPKLFDGDHNQVASEEALLSSFLDPAINRLPERLDVPSAWSGHIPFLAWVLKNGRPNKFVELGTHFGVSYCSACQVIKAESLPTQCYAVDTWQGDEHAGFYGDEVYEGLRSHHDPLYGEFSHLLRTTFDEAVTQFEDKSVDLLHIDGLHTYEAVKHDFETWYPKMSSRGVILFHDIAVKDREGFGVWKFWDEVKREYPTFGFSHSSGLGVLAVGRDFPALLRPMFTADDSLTQQIKSYFENLGEPLSKLNSAAMWTKEIEGELRKVIAGYEEQVHGLTIALKETRITNRIRRIPPIRWARESFRAFKDKRRKSA